MRGDNTGAIVRKLHSETVAPREGRDPMQRLEADDLKGVSETLLIPLHYHVEESKRAGGAFKDEMTERFHDAILYEWDRFASEPLRSGMPIRTAILDEQVGNFIAGAPDGLVVNLGAGLDTRFYRLDDGTIRWIELDLPNVIAFRRKLQEPQSERHQLVAASVLDEGWVRQVKLHARSRVLFVAEGLFPYFTEDEHRRIFGDLADGFPGQGMLFQTSAPSLIQAH